VKGYFNNKFGFMGKAESPNKKSPKRIERGFEGAILKLELTEGENR